MSNLDDRVKALLAKPSLEALSYILRHEETWPKNFSWNFDGFFSCAIGLSQQIWETIDRFYFENIMEKIYFNTIFFGFRGNMLRMR